MSNSRRRLLIALIVGGILSRLLPHPPNFTAIGAASVFAGAMIRDKTLSLMVPLAAMVLSDAVLGFHPLVPVVYASLGLSTLLGSRLGSSSSVFAFAGFGVLSSLMFYLTTNFGVWLLGGLYPRTVGGLFSCYVAALPFLKNMLCADILFSILLVSLLRTAEKLAPSVRMTNFVTDPIKNGIA